MKIRIATVALVLACVASAGCRQPDGDLPAQTTEQQNKTGDVARDLLNVASSQSNATEDLRQDLENLSETPPPPDLAAMLATRVSEAVTGSKLNEQSATALANHLFVATSARELSERQLTALKQDIAATLTQAGASAERAAAVGDLVGEIQSAVGTNQRRWWHLR